MDDHVLQWLEEEQWNTRVPKKDFPVYIRYGKFSRSERSFNFSTGKYERGISVYPARIENGSVRLDETQFRWLYITMADMIDENGDSLFKGRCVFALTGKEAGKGSDGEPVLMPSSIRVLPLTIDRRCYNVTSDPLNWRIL